MRPLVPRDTPIGLSHGTKPPKTVETQRVAVVPRLSHAGHAGQDRDTRLGQMGHWDKRDKWDGGRVARHVLRQSLLRGNSTGPDRPGRYRAA
jgi:hypothetical protein